MKTFILIYDPINGYAMPDGLVETFIEEVQPVDGEVTVGSEVLLTEMRAQHAEGKIKIEHIIFKDYDNDQDVWLEVNEAGQCDNYPRGFADVIEKALYRIMDVALPVNKSKREGLVMKPPVDKWDHKKKYIKR